MLHVEQGISVSKITTILGITRQSVSRHLRKTEEIRVLI
ncbi:hypothetical protein [Bacillus sp. AR18-7]